MSDLRDALAAVIAHTRETTKHSHACAGVCGCHGLAVMDAELARQWAASIEAASDERYDIGAPQAVTQGRVEAALRAATRGDV